MRGDVAKHLLDTLIVRICALGRMLSAGQLIKALPERQKRLLQLQFKAVRLLLIEPVGPADRVQHGRVRRMRRVKFDQRQPRCVQHWLDVFFHDAARFKAADELRQKLLLLLLAGVTLPAGGHVQDVAVKKSALTCFKAYLAMRQVVDEPPAADIEDLHRAVPVPWKLIAGKVMQVAQIGLVGKLLCHHVERLVAGGWVHPNAPVAAHGGRLL